MSFLTLLLSAIVLSQPFEDVLVSDIAKSNIEVARLHLEDLIDKPVIFHISKLEDVDWIENESVDLVFAATVMHLTDFDKAMDSFDRQLKPGGTLAIAAMGYSVWEDERLQSAWQRLFQTAGDLHWIKPTLKQDEATKQAAMRPILCSASAYDAVPLPTTFFEEGALRYKVNFPEGWSWYKCQVSDENEPFVPLWSQIGETDRIAYEQVEGWGTEVVLDGLKEIAESFPGLTELPEWGECCRVFEEEVGDGKAKGTWPHVLILATKKK